MKNTFVGIILAVAFSCAHANDTAAAPTAEITAPSPEPGLAITTEVVPEAAIAA